MHEGGAGAAKRLQIARGGRQGHIVGHAQSRRSRRTAFEAIELVKLEFRPGRGPRFEVVEEITTKDQNRLPVDDSRQGAGLDPTPDRPLGTAGDARCLLHRVVAVDFYRAPVGLSGVLASVTLLFWLGIERELARW